ncbi:alpha-L-fucosidase [Streptomyces scopuliridis]|uniref:Alpha-L-fucosidase n=1 Tax=Streptomyces scopuliridis TaxID=452529 RepID=A0ACD4ZUR6_9ACTN|nr:alpha-L-fucosidase [Streptomyces scopuliridis]WSC02205.1 alpha-L-fucosidase [Streptomyces scopuliridis]WSC04258.1 alpha-L-fucosidase [Streptomyces scopuliridis]
MTEFPRRHVLGMTAGAAIGAALIHPATADASPRTTLPGTETGTDTGTHTEGGGGDWGTVPAALPVPLERWFDNDGIDTTDARGGNFDGSGYTFPGEELPAGEVEIDGLSYLFPAATAGAKNNIVALGQRVELPPGRYLSGHFLAASSYGETSGEAVVHYADGTTSTAALGGPDWYGGKGALVAPYRYGPTGAKDPHQVVIAASTVAIDPGREAVALTLPVTRPAEANSSSLHIFALSLQPAVEGRALALRSARSTTSSLDHGAQSVEATVVNAGTVGILAADGLSLSVDVPGARTVAPARVTRLAPGDETRVRIGIRPGPGTAPGTGRDGRIVARGRGQQAAEVRRSLTLGVPDFRPTDDSLNTHQAPYWFQDAKFGVFIHWGVYSVPAWAPVGVQYAEWYWSQMQDPNNPTHAYHRQTYGESFAYDDFIPRFRAERFDPRSWVELFRDAGAQYHVLTSKHHEGFALWDTKVSDRNSVKMGPKRDLIRELFDASRRYTPELHRGLYFSMPEWFNPDHPWQGHAPRNPYTLEPVPYTGHFAGQDYIKDLQAPQMLELIEGYDPEILWCDIGGDNDSHRVLAEYFNHAKNRARPIEVTVNNRSGIGPHDFTTPEYTTYDSVVTAKWEASRGLDPRSYGYNQATPDDKYMTTEEVVHSLVDIVSKNGNFLLDIGPRADGTIPEIMERRLRETGEWLKVNGEAIYGSTYWARMPQLGEDLRFTVRPEKAFYIHSLTRPGSTLTVEAPVPVRPGDRVTLLGHDRPLSWRTTGGKLVVDVPSAARASGRHVWVFKVDWRS